MGDFVGPHWTPLLAEHGCVPRDGLLGQRPGNVVADGWVMIDLPCHSCVQGVAVPVQHGERGPWKVEHNPHGGHTVRWDWPDITPRLRPLPITYTPGDLR